MLKMKKLLAVILTATMLLSCLPINVFAVEEATIIDEGTCGEAVTWRLDSTGVLTISGSGNMDDWDWNKAPWYEHKDDILSVVIADGVTSICNHAFYYCTNLKTVNIPESVTSIGNGAFEDCTNLKTVNIPESVTSIGSYAFYACTSFETITIPSSVTTIGNAAFTGSLSLTEISVDPANANYSSENGVLFNKDKTDLIQYPIGKTNTSYTIPSSVITIGNYAFYHCTNFKTVTIPSSVTTIGDEAFWNVGGIKSITIPGSVTSIGDRAFAYCHSLTEITFEGTTVPEVSGENPFKGSKSLKKVYVPEESYDAYVEAYTQYLPEGAEIVAMGNDESTEVACISTESKEKAVLGSQFDFKVYLGGTYDGYSFKLTAPEGLSILSVTPANSDVNVDKMDGYWLVSVLGGLDKVDSEKEEIVTVTVEVDRNAELGNRELSLSEVMISNNIGDEVDLVNCNYATVEIIKCIPGDVNGDDVFNYFDVSKLYAYYRGLADVSEWADVDINGDGTFNYFDISKLYAIYRGLADFPV